MNLETLTTEEVFAIYRNEGGKLRRGYMCDRPKDYAVYDACYNELFQRIQSALPTTQIPVTRNSTGDENVYPTSRV